MNNKPDVSQLILEVGRKCNLCCEHCLRGEAEDTAMSYKDAIKTIDSFESIDSITFTGGEPTLYEDFICDVIDYIMNTRKSVNGFYIASNATIFAPKLMIKLCEFKDYVDDDFNCVFDISADQYHDYDSQVVRMLKNFTFVGSRDPIAEQHLILEGRAADWACSTRMVDCKCKFTYDDPDEPYIDMIYVNAKGNILPYCDYSYKTQDQQPQVNINDGDNIVDLINEYNRQKDVEVSL